MGKKGNIKLILPKNRISAEHIDTVLRVIVNNGGKVSSDEFHSLLKREYSANNFDVTTISHLSVAPRYFGMLRLVDREEYLVTDFGYEYISSADEYEKIDNIMQILSSITFGCANEATSSNSKVEAPVVFLKGIQELQGMSIKQFAVLLFLLECDNMDFNSAIDKIKSIDNIDEQIGIIKKEGGGKFTDPKINVFFEDLKIVVKKADKKYYLSEYVEDNYSPYIEELNPFNNVCKASSAEGKKQSSAFESHNQKKIVDFTNVLNQLKIATTYKTPIYKEHRTRQRSSTRKSFQPTEYKSTSKRFSQEQKNLIGWTGEKYIYNLLSTKEFCDQIGISSTDIKTITWFNEDFSMADKWEDKSVGHGCDIEIQLRNGNILYFEIKTSFNMVNYFTATTNELLKMDIEGDKFFLIKVNNLYNLSLDKSPSITIIKNPIKELLALAQIKEVTFYC